MSEHLKVVCPHCNATNRVERGRFGPGAHCGGCQRQLLSRHPIELTAANLDGHLESNDLPVVVDFWAPWCGPCRMMAPAYDQAALELASEARIAKLDTERHPDVAARFGIRGIPTLIVFRNGREVSRQSGTMDLPGLLRWIRANV